MKNLLQSLALLLLFSVFISCKPEEPVNPIEPDEIEEGINYSPKEPDADKELSITFKAPVSSQLYGYEGDVYVHIGVIVEGVWKFVPADWNVNLSKCKMTSKGDNTWDISLAPSIREWFGAGETPVTKIGIVIRSSDGTKKGIIEDSFINIVDNKHKGFEPAPIKNAPLPNGVKHGINIVNNSTVTFVLYDKDKNGNHKDYAHIIGDFNDWTLSNDEKSQMNRDEQAGCWWITLSGLESTKEYAFQYYVGTKNGDAIRLADAYAEKILDPSNDKYIYTSTYPENKTSPSKAIGISSVFKIQKDAYNWQVTNYTPPQSDELVIYELLLRDFTASGDINGAMQKLDYLKDLGVNAIELLPVQEFDGNDSWGYNPCFYFALDKAYGTKTMYKQFIDACHQRGMAVIFDVVYNHATGNHPFAKLYWDASKNKTSPENPWFNVDAPHPFSVFHDFNHESQLVRDFVKRNLEFLITEYKIDGFRFDLTKGFTQKKSNESSAGNYDESRVAILKDYNAKIKSVNPKVFVILEHFCDNKEELELTTDGMFVWGNKNEAYCETAMGWDTPSKTNFNGINGWTRNWSNNNVVGYMESHDEERIIFKAKNYGKDEVKNNLAVQMQRAALNAAFFFPIPGPKMIWQFGEMGYDISIDENGRTGKKPILWNYLDVPERKNLVDSYKQMIKVRESVSSTYTNKEWWTMEVAGSNWANGRRITLNAPNKKMVILGNFRTDATITMNANFPETGVWKDIKENSDFEVTDKNKNYSLAPNEYKVFLYGVD